MSMIIVVTEFMNYLISIRYRIFYFLLIVAVFNLFLSSCRSLSPVVSNDIVRFTGDDIYRRMNTNQSDVITYSARRMMINIVDDDREMNLRGAVRIKRDSAVLITVNAFAGIEAVRLLFTADSVMMIDRINKSYFAGNYYESRRFMPYTISLEILQNVFLASPFSFTDQMEGLEGSNENYEFDDQRLKLRFSVDGSLRHAGGGNSDMLQIVLDKDFLTRSVDFHSDINEIFASLQYNSYLKLPEHILPDDISFNFVSHNIPLMAGLRLSGIEVNRQVKFPFNIPSGYSRLKN